MKAFKMACLQYKPSPVNFEQQRYMRQELISAKNSLLKFCLSQLKHLDLGVIDRGDDGKALATQSLTGAWEHIQTNLQNEGINYGEMDPSKMPAWPPTLGSRNNSGNRNGTNVDWLNQDSIESLKQASAGFTLAPQSSRRVEPIRLSMPHQADPGYMTQRNRCGKLGNSELYPCVIKNGQKVNLLSGKTNLRQALSVHKVDSRGG